MKPKSGTCMLQQPFKVFNSTVRQLKTPTHELMMHQLRPPKKNTPEKINAWKSLPRFFGKMVIHSVWKMMFKPLRTM